MTTSSKTATGREHPPIVAICGKATVLALTIASVAWFAFFAKALFLKYPPVWPDEACFANPAINLLYHGKMSTELLAGTLPGIGQSTYWMPPLYFLYIASVFRFTGPGLVPLRLASTAAALVVLLLTYLLALRSGLGGWVSLLPVCLVALDTVFLRGALIGRMDMLALVFILLSLWLATKSVSVGYSFLTGVACGLAALTHPIGAVAPVSVMAWRLASRDTRTLRCLLPLAAGILMPLLPWVAYILIDTSSFVGQFGAQLARKSAGHASVNLTESFFRPIAQYAFPGGRLIDAIWEFPLWLIGIAGLGGTTFIEHPKDCPARRCLLLLGGCQAVIIALVLWSGEMWYTVYVIPITAIGVCHLLNSGRSAVVWTGWRTAFTAVILIWAGGLLFNNLQHTARLSQPDTDYVSWSSEIGRKIPRGSKLLLSIIPDPYFGLMGRSDLSLREFLPEKIPINDDRYWRYLMSQDYVIVGLGPRSPSATVEEFLRSNATLIDTVGRETEEGYFARIYRVNKPSLVHH